MLNLQGLDNLEEQVTVNYILKLDNQEFSLWLADIATIANSLRAKRNIGSISTN
jgi:hypothetical protein